jgi:F0F1-type ATP synthase assembly protein I
MPLPQEPTRAPRNRKNEQAAKDDQDLLIKAILIIGIGLGVLLSPYFVTSPGMQSIVANSTLVGWFALVLGLGFGIAWVRRRMKRLK